MQQVQRDENKVTGDCGFNRFDAGGLVPQLLF